MRIYNYSDKPVYIKGVPYDQIELFIPSDVWEMDWFLHHSKSLHNVGFDQLIITNDSTKPNGYSYQPITTPIPDISVFSFILVTAISLHLLIKIVQKVKQS
jgi:hypothetical protein